MKFSAASYSLLPTVSTFSSWRISEWQSYISYVYDHIHVCSPSQSSWTLVIYCQAFEIPCLAHFPPTAIRANNLRKIRAQGTMTVILLWFCVVAVMDGKCSTPRIHYEVAPNVMRPLFEFATLCPVVTLAQKPADIVRQKQVPKEAKMAVKIAHLTCSNLGVCQQ